MKFAPLLYNNLFFILDLQYIYPNLYFSAGSYFQSFNIFTYIRIQLNSQQFSL